MSSIVGGLPDEDVVDMNNITNLTLLSDKARLPLDPDEYPNKFETASEPVYRTTDIGNLVKNTAPLLVNVSTGNFVLEQERPLINAGDNQVYLDARGLYRIDRKKD